MAQRTDRKQTARRAPTRRKAPSGTRATTTRASSKRGAGAPAHSRHGATQTQRASRHPLVLRIVVIIAAMAVFLFIATNAVTCQVTNGKYSAVEKWRGTVAQACTDCGLGDEWTDAILAAMYVESGGDEDVRSVEGVKHDIMQAAEGKYGDIVKMGSSRYGVKAQTCEASIYAGVLEFKQNLELWHDCFEQITPQDAGEIQLVIQGYNFGAVGWHRWCKANGITEYTVELAQKYSDEKMPEDAKGTPTHAEKWLTAYERIVDDLSE